METENRGTADEYHGKTIPLETATQLVMVNEPVNIPDLEHVIPYKQARALILQNPDHIVALELPLPVRAGESLPAIGRVPGGRRAVRQLRQRSSPG